MKDYGGSWNRSMKGLKHSYLTGIAVDSGNPDVVIVSASDSPFKSFSPNGAETFLYKMMKMAKNGRLFQTDFLTRMGPLYRS